mgnify:CR=1 FL=1
MIRLFLILLLSSTLLTACSDSTTTGKSGKSKKRTHLVETQVIARESIAIRRERTGTLKIRRLVRIHSQEEGQITQLPYYEGDRVKQGMLLAALEDQLLQAELNKATANLRQAGQDLERLNRLTAKQLTSDEEVARAQTALEVAEAEQRLLEARLGYTRITAPFSGIISERLIEPGDVATKHHHLLTLINPDSLIAEAAVSDLLLPHLKADAPVTMQIDALGDQLFPGKILRIHPQLDPVSRQGRVEVAFDEIPPQARSGQLARLSFTIPARDRLMTPFNALQRDREGEFLFLLRKGKARLIRVKSGVRIGEQVEIVQGIKDGDILVTRGFMGLTDGKPVTATGNDHGARPHPKDDKLSRP